MKCAFLRTLVLGTLLLILPFGGMRVICVAAPEDAATSATAEGELSDCERLCPLHETGDTSSNTENDRCALSAGASSLMSSSGLAVVRPLEAPPVPVLVRVVYAEFPRFAPEPVLPHFVPPPELRSL